MTESHSAISLVIPAFNRADLITETLDSALAQTYPFSEIIVVDDGSTDDTETVLLRYEGRITVIRTQNSGVQSARNTGIAATKTKFVAVCDSDDLMESNLCETIVPWLDQHPDIDICFCNFITFDNEIKYSDKFSQAPRDFFIGAVKKDEHFITKIPDLYCRTLKFQPLFQSGLIIKKIFFDQIGGYDSSFNGVGAEDWEFTLRAITLGQVALCNIPLARVRRHSGNDSANAIHMNLGEAQILEFAIGHHKNISDYKTRMLAVIEQRRMLAFDAAFSSGNFNLAKEIIKKIKKPNFKLKFFIKKIISALPKHLREWIWKITQNQK